MSKNLDSELAEAAGLDGSKGDQSTVSADGPLRGTNMSVPQPPEPRKEASARTAAKPNFALLGVLLAMAASIVCLFLFGFNEAAIYSLPVEQFMAKRSEMVDRRVRIDGELVPNSLMKRDKPCEFRFRIRGGGAELSIRYPQCIVPDTFRDVPEGGVMVTAEGKLRSEGDFEATLIMAKCSSKYDPKTHTMGEDKQAKAP